MVVIVCGSRTWTDSDIIRRELSSLPVDTLIIHGDAVGADRLADRVAQEIGLNVIAIPAKWKLFGSSAGILRNKYMLDLGPDLIIAFRSNRDPKSGTADMIKRARSKCVQVKEIMVPSFSG